MPSNTIISTLPAFVSSIFIKLLLLILFALARAAAHVCAVSFADNSANSPVKAGTVLSSSTPITAAGSSLAIKSALALYGWLHCEHECCFPGSMIPVFPKIANACVTTSLMFKSSRNSKLILRALAIVLIDS